MEEILRKLQKDASGHKHKAIRDACIYAFGECAAAGDGVGGGGSGLVWYTCWLNQRAPATFEK